MNFITDLLLSKCRKCVYNAILIVVDCYIKMTHYIMIIKTVTAVKLTELFYEKIICQFDIFKRAVSD